MSAASARWDYVFLFSNAPMPGLLEKVRCAISAGRRVVVVYMSRPWTALQMEDLAGADVIRVDVGFHSVGAQRAVSMFTTARQLQRDVFAYVAPRCDVYVDAIDLLAMAQMLGRGKHCRFRFEVRDLHHLQLGRDLRSRAVQLVERLLLRRVSVLVLTSRAHFDRYYRSRFGGRVSYVENVPARDAWRGFQRIASPEFVIGFVGVLRYRRCLEALIDAVRTAHDDGYPIRLRLAGGGIVDELKDYAGNVPYIEFLGPFQYDKSVRALFADLDLLNSVYDADDANVRLAISNKYYESQIAGIPVMVAAGTHLATLVREAGIGIAVPHADARVIASRIKEAYDGADWYTCARARLAAVDVNRLFAQHEAEVSMAVLAS